LYDSVTEAIIDLNNMFDLLVGRYNYL